MKKLVGIFFLLLAGIFLVGLTAPVKASPLPQLAYHTPTARADGRILYVVRKGDSCISVSLLNNITIEKLRALNNIVGSDCLLREGQELLLGTSGPLDITVTPGPSPTATPLLPTSTPQKGKGSICIWVYNDVNGNAQAETAEVQLAGGAISLSDRSGKVNLTGTTQTGTTALCFDNLEEGEYSISAAVPQGYNPTTVNSNKVITLLPGDKIRVNFGAQVSLLSAPTAETNTGAGSVPLLGVLGGVLVLAGIGLGVYVWRSKTR